MISPSGTRIADVNGGWGKTIDPEIPLIAATFGTDALVQFGGSLRGGSDVPSAAISAAAALGAGTLGYKMTTPYVAAMEKRLGNWAPAVPIVTGYLASVGGGWVGDRIGDMIRGGEQQPVQQRQVYAQY
jgi:hypothetical protein